MQQRNGRGLRQGNTNKSIRIHAYLAKGSFDGYRWQSINAKRDWQDLIWNGGDRVENLAQEGNMSREEMAIMFAADPDAARAKLLADKSEAEQAALAGQRRDAAETFVKFQAMSRNFAALKSKETQTAARLKSQIDKLRLALERNGQFYHKGLLSLDKEALINPDNGIAFYDGAAMEIEDGDETAKWVVSGVDLSNGTVSLREYGVPEAKTRVVPMDKLRSGVRACRTTRTKNRPPSRSGWRIRRARAWLR